MPTLFRKTKSTAGAFCERCGAVCDAACRADAIRERTLTQFMAYGWRSV